MINLKKDDILKSHIPFNDQKNEPVIGLSTESLVGASILTQHFSETAVPDLIEKQAQLAPDSTAGVSADRTMTYRELEEKATSVSFELQRLGVRENMVVGIALNSLSFLAGALGILKSGAAYLPIDLTCPRNRLEYILTDAKPDYLLTESSLANILPKGKWKTLFIDKLPAKPTHSYCPKKNVQPDHSAYIIYTSGSTGKPKGVEIPHRGLSNLVSWHQKAFLVTAQDRASQFASLGFDAAVWEIWPYLCSGATLYFPDQSTRLQPKEFQSWLLINKITISFVPPFIAEELMSFEWPAHTSLRILLTGADVLRHSPPPGLPFSVINNYGPTECSVVATSGSIQAEEDSETKCPPLGFPISKTEILILDDNLKRVPLNQEGEIFIGGAGLAKGYLHDNELTREKFLPHPFKLDARLYRTGDLGKIAMDGQLQFLGRLDNQFKIHGHRIDPQEIEMALSVIPNIKASIVVPYGSEPQRKILAYLQLQKGAHILVGEVRVLLRKTLPEYMIPALFVRVDELPRTINGKVDRKSLPEPTASNVLQQNNHSFPRGLTHTEEILLDIMKNLLTTENIGVDDDFFALGGHSLLGTQMISRIRSNFGIDLALKTIFEAPTIAALSSEIEKKIRVKTSSTSF